MFKSITQKLIAVTVVVAIMAGVVIYFVILPTARDIQELNESVLNERLDLERKYKRGQLLNKTINDFDEVKNRESDLVKSFMKAGDELEFIQLMESLGIRNNVALNLSIKPASPVGNSPTLLQMPVSISVNGVFDDVMRLIENIEQLDIYINFDNAVIRSDSQIIRRLEGVVSLTMDGIVYQIKDESEPEL